MSRLGLGAPLRGDVDRRLDAVVALPRLVQCVPDGCQPDPPGDRDRADHVEHDADVALAVPPETGFVDDVEQVVGCQSPVRG